MRLGFFLREALRALRRNAVPSFAAMATVLVTVLILGVFIPVVQATTGAANEVRGRVIADVYLKTGADDRDVARVRNLIETQVPYVGRVQYLSKEQAYRDERKRNPEAYDLLGANPLPDTFRVTPTGPTTSRSCATRSRRSRRPAGGRRSTRRSTTSAIARRTRTRSSPSRAS